MRYPVLGAGLQKVVSGRYKWRVLTKRPVVIPCVIALLPICWQTLTNGVNIRVFRHETGDRMIFAKGREKNSVPFLLDRLPG